jgi:hypothetical protein
VCVRGMDGPPAIVQLHGCVYRVPSAPFEPDDVLYERAWHVAKAQPQTQHQFQHAQCLSHMHVNERRYGMSYTNTERSWHTQ